MTNPPTFQPVAALRRFLQSESASGFVLMFSAVLALIVANSPLAPTYFDILAAHIAGLSVLHWINDGLMALFFLLVGLEIKRQLLEGQLRTWPARAVPGAAALGGIVVPALVYVAVNWTSPSTLRGWAIPAATDIAFTLGVLSLLGSRVPTSLKLFLTALAILDDLGAILVIALFYTSDLSLPMLGLAVLVLAALVVLNLSGVRRLVPYMVLGGLLWLLVLKSGVHATVAGVLLSLTIPLRHGETKSAGSSSSPLHRLEHALHPWSAYAVIPMFGLANAGVALSGISWQSLSQPVTLGVVLGLFFGKQAGVFGSVWLIVKLGLGHRPTQATWLQVYGVAVLCGVGFTMSLFIGLLAFAQTPEFETATKIGVLAGSILSIFGAAGILRFSGRR
jgi:NhaA family Na+:H+ antiporter